MAARFIRIAIKDRLQVNALQSTEQQRDDGDRLDHTKPHSGLIPHVSLPDREKVRIAVTSHLKPFNKLYLYQRPTYGTGLTLMIHRKLIWLTCNWIISQTLSRQRHNDSPKHTN